ncbi:MAG: twin-arginine translocase subunit TatC [Deltaproteobacteria bacterium]|nr:twin-arginine translocase subunit TatC [Deltaproteobacteria bacterium]
MNKTEETLITHLIELRKCLIKSVVCILTGFFCCAYFSKDIYHYLSLPLANILPKNSFFISTHPFEAWLTYLKTSLIAGLFISSPAVFWFIWRFVSPALYKKEKKYSIAFVGLTSLFFIGGAVFGYFCVFPYAFGYFIGITEGTDIVFLPQMNSYLGFAFRLLLSFGIIFELPIVMIILSAMGIVTSKQFALYQKYMIVAAFVVAAILTPPDVISQILMAVPLIALYEVGLMFAWMVEKKNKPQ